jgi:hypothetical protein
MNKIFNYLFIFLFACINYSFAQTAENPDDNANDIEKGFCNNNLTGTQPTPPNSCLVTIGTSPITGSLFEDDGEDIFLFPLNLSGSQIFTFSGTGSINVRIVEYTGTTGVGGNAVSGTGTTITNGGSFNFDASKKYYLNIERNSNATYSIAFTSGPLPVELSSFSGKPSEAGIELSWRTSQERNSQSFEIQHSIDAVNYKTIGEIKALGNSQTGKNYQFYDTNPIEGINYYRLKQNDLDKSFSLLRPISVIYVANEMDLKLYPNPSEKMIRLPIDFLQNAKQIVIYDNQGKICQQTNPADIQNRQLSIEKLKAGIYIIQAQSDLQVNVRRFIKID